MNNSKNVKQLSPFVLFCQKVIPLAFDESMSYYECLCALYNYIHNEIAPAINTNADAITELQDYVTNYFDNLDIQTEINNKLDEMAENGELAEIIAQYVELQGVLAYDTLNDLINAENLVDGSFTKTFGKLDLNDGDGAFYKIRTVTTSDVIDGINKIALTNYPTLIAVLIIDNNIINLNNSVDTINTNIGTMSNLNTTEKSNLVGAINEVNSKSSDSLTEIVIFGDSWSDPTSLDAIWGTQNYVGKELNLNVNNYAKSGAYMSGTGANDLQGQVSTFNSDTSVNKIKVKYIVILGGINDYRNNVTWSSFYTKLEEQIELLKTYCPQAKIIFVSNCQWYYDETQGNYWCGIHEEIHATEKIVTYNIFGTLGHELYNSNNYFHLTQTGQKVMLSNIVATLTGGEIQYFEDSVSVTNGDGTMVYSTQRVGNMVILNIKLTPSASKTFYSFANPSGYYFNYYTHRFGVVGRVKEIGIINIGYNAIAFDFSTALTINEQYDFTLTLPLNHK